MPGTENLKIEYVAVDSLTPYEKNARSHGKEDLKAIEDSIREFGFVDPIGVWHDIIVEGHGRLIAAKQIGMTEVPVIRLDQLTDEQRRAYALAHNKTAELSSWNFDLLAAELNNISEIDMTAFGFDAEGIGIEENEIEEVETPEPPKKPKSKLNDIYVMGGCRLICGDSTDPNVIARLMNGEKADMLLTDPPYNVALGMGGSKDEARKRHRRTDGLVIMNDKMEDEDFYNFLLKFYKAAFENMKEGAAFYVWHADNESLNFRKALKDAGVQLRQVLIWNKSAFTLGRQDYQWKHEPCLYGWKDGAAHYFVDDRTQATVFEDAGVDIDKMKKDEMRELLKKLMADKISTTVLDEDRPTVSKEHPTMKPLKLLARQIKNSSRPGDIVLDTFGGSGSTLMACEQLNRKCYMCELDPQYVDVIVERWEKYTGLKAELINDQDKMEK